MILAKNRKALFHYEVIQKYTAGIELLGFEVKAIREHKAHLEGSFVRLLDGELFIVGMKIDKYSKYGGNFNEDIRDRNRRLLLTSSEVASIARSVAEKGKTAVPLALLLQKNLIKLEFAVVRGKKEFEKKVVEKERQIKRDTEREVKALKQAGILK